MGTTQSLVSTPNVVAAALIIGIAASVWRNRATGSSGIMELPRAEKSAAGKKGKKKKTTGVKQLDVAGSGLLKSDDGAGGGRSATPDLGASSLSENTIPGGIGESGEDIFGSSASLAKPMKDKKKKKGKKSASQATTSQTEDSGAAVPIAGPSRPSAASKNASGTVPRVSKPDEETWTRVENKRKTSSQHQNTTSDAGITTTSMDDEGSLASLPDKSEDSQKIKPPPKTLAEKMLPKGRKTAVDDMLEESHYPELARVIRVTPAPNEKPAAGFSWADYEDVEDVRAAEADGEDDGWGIVKSRGRAKHTPSTSSSGVLQPPPKAPETLTKKQRQRLAKREAEKAVKAQGESERLAQLSKLQREREKERIDEIHKAGKSKLSGGQTMVVDDMKPVWS